MTPLERKELDALIKLFRAHMADKKAPEVARQRAEACVGALVMFRGRCDQLRATRKKFKLVAGGRL